MSIFKTTSEKNVKGKVRKVFIEKNETPIIFNPSTMQVREE